MVRFSKRIRFGRLENCAQQVYHPLAVASRSFPKALIIMLLLALTVSGCTSTRSRGGWGGSHLTRGMVEVDAATSALVLSVAGKQLSIEARADLMDQLDRLPGAFVAIDGVRSKEAIRVRRFEILEAPDGLAPLVGAVIVDQSGVMLQDELSGNRLALRGAALVDLKKMHGARVWVTGSVVGPQVLLLAHWGLLTSAP